jgi:hypothetical protein
VLEKSSGTDLIYDVDRNIADNTVEVVGDAGWLTLEEIYWYGSKRGHKILIK